MKDYNPMFFEAKAKVPKPPKKTKDEKIEDQSIIENLQSRFIIITNRPSKKIPQPIADRTGPIEINAPVGGVIDDIRVNIENVMKEYTQATTEIKLEVLNFIEDRLKDKITNLSYRLYERCVIFRLSENPNWKKFCVPILRVS